MQEMGGGNTSFEENHKTWQGFIQGEAGGGTLHGGILHLRGIIRHGRLSSRGSGG